MTVYSGIDLAVTLRFEEEEARFLAGVCLATLDSGGLTEQQRQVMRRIAQKFILGGERVKDEAVERHGFDAVTDAAGEALAAYPDVDVVRL